MPNTGYFIQQITRRGAGNCSMQTSKKDKSVIFIVNKKAACFRMRRSILLAGEVWRWTVYGRADKIALLY